jgi:hypothetical protein
MQHTNIRRQAVKEFCEDEDIPLKDTMAIFGMDYTSEAQTCGSDTDI